MSVNIFSYFVNFFQTSSATELGPQYCQFSGLSNNSFLLFQEQKSLTETGVIAQDSHSSDIWQFGGT